MNNIDFLKYNNFPVSSETYDFMKGMIDLVSSLAGSGNYIVSGCIETAGVVSAGIVCVNGEIMPFQGGTKSDYVIVSETKTDVKVYDETFEDVYTTRKLIFGTGTGQIAWSEFSKKLLKPSIIPISGLTINSMNSRDVWCDQDISSYIGGKYSGVIWASFQGFLDSIHLSGTVYARRYGSGLATGWGTRVFTADCVNKSTTAELRVSQLAFPIVDGYISTYVTWPSSCEFSTSQMAIIF